MDDTPLPEELRFAMTEIAIERVKNFNRRLGFELKCTKKKDREHKSIDCLKWTDIILMYDICRYEKAWYPNQVSYWCALFDNDDLEVCLIKRFEINKLTN